MFKAQRFYDFRNGNFPPMTVEWCDPTDRVGRVIRTQNTLLVVGYGQTVPDAQDQCQVRCDIMDRLRAWEVMIPSACGHTHHTWMSVVFELVIRAEGVLSIQGTLCSTCARRSHGWYPDALPTDRVPKLASYNQMKDWLTKVTLQEFMLTETPF